MSPTPFSNVLAEVRRLRDALALVRKRNQELRAANAELRIERDAADVLLGEAMDQLRRAGA